MVKHCKEDRLEVVIFGADVSRYNSRYNPDKVSSLKGFGKISFSISLHYHYTSSIASQQSK